MEMPYHHLQLDIQDVNEYSVLHLQKAARAIKWIEQIFLLLYSEHFLIFYDSANRFQMSFLTVWFICLYYLKCITWAQWNAL